MSYRKKKRFGNLRRYSPKLMAFVSIPIFLILFLVLITAFYGDPIRSFFILIFSLLNLVLLVPFLIFPIVNIFLLKIVELYHNFILNAIGLEGDAITLTISWFFAILYTIFSYVLFILIIVATTLSAKGILTKTSEKFLRKFGFLSLIKPRTLKLEKLRNKK
jgi:hypothetical protein